MWMLLLFVQGCSNETQSKSAKDSTRYILDTLKPFKKRGGSFGNAGLVECWSTPMRILHLPVEPPTFICNLLLASSTSSTTKIKHLIVVLRGFGKQEHYLWCCKMKPAWRRQIRWCMPAPGAPPLNPTSSPGKWICCQICSLPCIVSASIDFIEILFLSVNLQQGNQPPSDTNRPLRLLATLVIERAPELYKTQIGCSTSRT